MSDITERSLGAVRAEYVQYLKSHEYAETTARTSAYAAFYLWDRLAQDAFWDTVLSDDFENISKMYMESLYLKEVGSAGTDRVQWVNWRMAHLRRFRRFLQERSGETVPMRQLPQRAPRKARVDGLDIPRPSAEQAQSYLSRWETQEEFEKYRHQEDALSLLFRQLCPNNEKIEDILLKVATLNNFFSTNIYGVYPVAAHILSLHIDGRLQRGDISLVGDIQRVTVKGKEINFYSFATKYCSHHRPDVYPIYDRYVDDVLRYFQRADCFSTIASFNLKDYVQFKQVKDEFSSFYELGDISPWARDKYLWMLGKEHFTKTYGASNTDKKDPSQE